MDYNALPNETKVYALAKYLNIPLYIIADKFHISPAALSAEALGGVRRYKNLVKSILDWLEAEYENAESESREI